MGAQSKNFGAIESQPHASLPGPDLELTPACPNGKGIVATSGEAASGESNCPAPVCNIPRVPLAIEGERAARGTPTKAHQRKRNQSLPAPSIRPYPSIQQMCEKSNKKRGEKGTRPVLSILKGWIEMIDMLAETFVQRPCQVLGRRSTVSLAADLLARHARGAGLQPSTEAPVAPSPACLWMQPGKNTLRKAENFTSFRFSSAFHVCQKMDAQGTDHCRPAAGSCHDFLHIT